MKPMRLYSSCRAAKANSIKGIAVATPVVANNAVVPVSDPQPPVTFSLNIGAPPLANQNTSATDSGNRIVVSLAKPGTAPTGASFLARPYRQNVPARLMLIHKVSKAPKPSVMTAPAPKATAHHWRRESRSPKNNVPIATFIKGLR